MKIRKIRKESKSYRGNGLAYKEKKRYVHQRGKKLTLNLSLVKYPLKILLNSLRDECGDFQ